MNRPPEFHIDREGTWRYRGSVIGREAMVRLFAGMLRKRGADYVLQTPEQVLQVRVDDAPFVIVDCECGADGGVPRVWMITNLGERLLLGREHPLWLRRDPERGEVRAYVSMRDGIPALIHRNVFYRLADMAETDPGTAMAGIRSDGEFFTLE